MGGKLSIRLLLGLVIICIHFVVDTSATRCIPKDSCDVDSDCGICDKAESLDTCKKIGFCDWTSTCGPAPGCSWFNNSTCTSVTNVTVTTFEQEEMCALTQMSSVCVDMDFCEWKDDCRECSNLNNRDCVKRDFCMWDQGTLPKYPITTTDILFVVASVVLELYTTFRLFKVVFLSVFQVLNVIHCVLRVQYQVGLDTCVILCFIYSV